MILTTEYSQTMCFGKKTTTIYFIVDLNGNLINALQNLHHEDVPRCGMELFSICVNNGHPASKHFLPFVRFQLPQILKDPRAERGEITTLLEDVILRAGSIGLNDYHTDLLLEGNGRQIENLRQAVIPALLMFNFLGKTINREGKTTRNKGEAKYECYNIHGYNGNPLFGISCEKERFSIPLGWDKQLKKDSAPLFQELKKMGGGGNGILTDHYKKHCGNFTGIVFRLSGKTVYMSINFSEQINIGTI